MGTLGDIYNAGKSAVTKPIKFGYHVATGNFKGAVNDITGQGDAADEQRRAYEDAKKQYGQLDTDQRQNYLGPGGSLDQQNQAWNDAQGRSDAAWGGAQGALGRLQGTADYNAGQLSRPGMLEGYAGRNVGSLEGASNAENFYQQGAAREGALARAMDIAHKANLAGAAVGGMAHSSKLARINAGSDQRMVDNYLAQEGGLASAADAGMRGRLGLGADISGRSDTLGMGRLGQLYGEQAGIAQGQAGIASGQSGAALGIGAGEAGSAQNAYGAYGQSQLDLQKNRIMAEVQKGNISMEQANQFMQELMGGAKIAAGVYGDQLQAQTAQANAKARQG